MAVDHDNVIFSSMNQRKDLRSTVLIFNTFLLGHPKAERVKLAVNLKPPLLSTWYVPHSDSISISKLSYVDVSSTDLSHARARSLLFVEHVKAAANPQTHQKY